MSTPPRELRQVSEVIARPGGPSAKTFSRAGSPNHQDGSKEEPMLSPHHPGPDGRQVIHHQFPGAPRRWPLTLLALPAAVAIWSGWVGLGEMSGFGVVHLLPGIADRVEVNSAITLPVGVEAYSAYALGTWLSSRPIARSARRFAAWSSLAALGLGLLGQVVYHLLTSHGYGKAPLPVVVFVSCLPVLVLGAGASLHHLLGNPGEPATPAPELPATPARPVAGQRRRRGKRPAPRRLLADYLDDARAQLDPGIDPTPSWCRQVTGCSAGTSVKLSAALRAEQADGHTDQPGEDLDAPESAA